MFKNIEKIFFYIINIILPERKDFTIVKKIDEEQLNHLPKGPLVDNMDWVRPLFHYKDDTVRAIIWELKYRENTLPLEFIGKILYEEIIDLQSDIILFDNRAEFLLIPIPITHSRRAERGFNQSELIARSILENDNARTLLYAPQWFEKIKDTQSQSHSVSKQERLENLHGCFRADGRVEGKYIILIDDVITTGSTLLEAKKTLEDAGALDVFAFTIAH